MTDEPIKIFRSGNQVWGAGKILFQPTGVTVSVFVDAEANTVPDDWKLQFLRLETEWDAMGPALEATLPGGLEASTLCCVDLRSHMKPSTAVLEFSSSSDIFDWYVRLDSDWRIEVAGPRD